MSEHVRPPEPPPPFDPQLDLIGDMERTQDWIVDHRTRDARRADAPET